MAGDRVKIRLEQAMSTQAKTSLTPEEYLEIERKAERKSEYYQGEMFLLAGGSARHGLIAINLGRELSLELKAEPCTVYSSDVRLRVSPARFYTYPDIMVVCGEPQYADDQKDTLLNPVIIVEVLSDSTKDYDLGRKFEFYRSLPSLREYLTVAQDGPHIDHWTRQEENRWMLAEVNGLGQAIQLASIDCVLSLAEVYYKVDWAA
jgi:Uma2 family endonuclease